MKELLNKIHNEKGLDFSEYKESTLKRRIERRMRLKEVLTYKDYISILDKEAAEYEKLIKDLTIKYTGFFREPYVYEAVSKKVFPEIFSRGKSIKIWSAGCATGEEVYSLAIEIFENLGARIRDFDIQIYGTDIDAECLENAKVGYYKNIKGVENKLLEKYFECQENEYKIKEELKSIVVFLKYDLVKGGVFNKFDFIVCRNVLIYFAKSLQEKVFKIFSENLKKNGFLVLGKSEAMMGESEKLFKKIDEKCRIFQKSRRGRR